MGRWAPAHARPRAARSQKPLAPATAHGPVSQRKPLSGVGRECALLTGGEPVSLAGQLGLQPALLLGLGEQQALLLFELGLGVHKLCLLRARVLDALLLQPHQGLELPRQSHMLAVRRSSAGGSGGEFWQIGW